MLSYEFKKRLLDLLKQVKKTSTYIFCIGLLLVLVSCGHKNISEKEKETFDNNLLSKNDFLLSSGEYEALIRLNIDYLKKAGKLGYREGKGLCYLNIARVNVSAGNYERALFFFEKAEKALYKSGNAYHKALFYDSYSKYYSHFKLYDKAIEYNDKALHDVKDVKKSEFNDKLLPRLLVNRGAYFAWKGWSGTSLKCLLKANELENSAYTNCMVAQYYLFTHQLEPAGIYIHRAEEKILTEKINNVESLWVYYTMGYYYNEINNYKEAEKNLKKALGINVKIRHTYSSHMVEVYQSLAEMYKKMHEEDKAYYYLKKYTEERGKSSSAQLIAINHTLDEFISETKRESDWKRNKLPLAIALAIAVVTVSGVYVRKVINTLRLKKRSLKMETEDLKRHVNTKMFQEVMELVKRNDSSFLLKFKELYPDFAGALLKINPGLENSELAFCAMLKLRLSSKEIADYTFVQHKSVQQKKYRIRKRLDIPAEEDIYDFFDGL
ncbi:tetratricopeptide repeat protein [Chryseobacterium rhizosphaerae]|uniref:tetratricopeptide repeat protein n=1 Tax=Chryseobacterium rhizosphaerae TaxID=395937 RepID=UPI002358C2AA|nr:tetratricopeptide repeat protein [Chryseobacterium rhizosphaerae]MDC8100661.1 tetratricopeptide repeat protein [Chryseobacterium rhizosphaerae]